MSSFLSAKYFLSDFFLLPFQITVCLGLKYSFQGLFWAWFWEHIRTASSKQDTQHLELKEQNIDFWLSCDWKNIFPSTGIDRPKQTGQT